MGRDDEYSTGTAFLLWLGCLFGAAGVHRFYLGKKWSGLLYLLTWGLFGIGTVYDAMTMQRLVDDANSRRKALFGQPERKLLSAKSPNELKAYSSAPQIQSDEQMRVALTRAAADNDGALSVTQGVLATGKDFAVVEEALDDMAKSGYVGIDNDPDSGVVIYTFRELG